jgi:hypothetical protein
VVRRKNVGLALATLALLAGVVAAVLVLLSPPGEPGWTGAVLRVPACPADTDGCRVFVVRESDAAAVADAPVIDDMDWSGSATTLNIRLPAGSYAISAEGCTGDQIASTPVSVTSGFHVDVDLSANWEIPKFLGRACPGFETAP